MLTRAPQPSVKRRAPVRTRNAKGAPDNCRAPPSHAFARLWASSILHQDQILARRPELLGLRDLDRPGHLALLVHPRTQVGRALPRNDLVLLVGPGQRDAL